jgi:hypothetical protein
MQIQTLGMAAIMTPAPDGREVPLSDKFKDHQPDDSSGPVQPIKAAAADGPGKVVDKRV